MKCSLQLLSFLMCSLTACDLDRIDPASGSGSKFITATGTNGTDFPYAVLSNADGSFIVAGSTEDASSGLESQMYIARIDKNGLQVDQNNFGTVRDERAHWVVPTGDDGFILLGSTKSASQPTFDVYVLKVNASLDKVWERTIGVLDTNEFAIGIVSLENNSYLIAYYTIPFLNPDKQDVFWVEINNNGVPVSSKKLLTGDILFSNMIRTTDHGIVMTGSVSDNNTSKAYLVKLNENGSKAWEVKYPTASSAATFGNDVVEMADQSLRMSGISDLSNEPQFFVAGFTSIGMPLMDTIWGGANEDGISGIIRSDDNHTVVTGFTASFNGTDQVYISKRDQSDGKDLWTSLTTKGDGGTDIQLCPDGGFIICAVGTGPTEGDIILIKTDKDGKYE